MFMNNKNSPSHLCAEQRVDGWTAKKKSSASLSLSLPALNLECVLSHIPLRVEHSCQEGLLFCSSSPCDRFEAVLGLDAVTSMVGT